MSALRLEECSERGLLAPGCAVLRVAWRRRVRRALGVLRRWRLSQRSAFGLSHVCACVRATPRRAGGLGAPLLADSATSCAPSRAPSPSLNVTKSDEYDKSKTYSYEFRSATCSCQCDQSGAILVHFNLSVISKSSSGYVLRKPSSVMWFAS